MLKRKLASRNGEKQDLRLKERKKERKKEEKNEKKRKKEKKAEGEVVRIIRGNYNKVSSAKIYWRN